jgi:alpha-tubulin suppressor-like RCC1 family protein
MSAQVSAGGAVAPAPVGLTVRPGSLTLGVDTACGIARSRGVVCIGGSLPGVGVAESEDWWPVQIAVPTIRRARSVALGQLYGCAITGGRVVRCFGKGPFRPGRAIPGIAGASTIAVSSTHACAIVAGGRVTCFGVNYGRSVAGAASPTTIYRRARLAAGITGARVLAISASVNCAILEDSSVRCWGAYDGVEPIREKRVPGLPPLKTLAGPSHVGSHFCGLTRQGATYCWGAREGGALGISSGVDVRLPTPDEAVRVPIKYAKRAVEVPGLPPMTEVATGPTASCARTQGNEVWCWGDPSIAAVGATTWPKKSKGRPEDAPPQRVYLGIG